MCQEIYDEDRAGYRKSVTNKMQEPSTLASATGSAATPEQPERDENDCAPYWLCRGMAEYIVELYGETCKRSATGGELCHNTADCITEWCVPCAAKAWLEEQKRLEKPLPPNDQAERPAKNQ